MSIGPKESKNKEGFYKELQVCKQMFYRSVLHSVGQNIRARPHTEAGGL